MSRKLKGERRIFSYKNWGKHKKKKPFQAECCMGMARWCHLQAAPINISDTKNPSLPLSNISTHKIILSSKFSVFSYASSSYNSEWRGRSVVVSNVVPKPFYERWMFDVMVLFVKLCNLYFLVHRCLYEFHLMIISFQMCSLSMCF